MENNFPQHGRSDHDILIELAVKVDRAITDIKEMDRNFVKTSADKIDRQDFIAWGKEFRSDMEKDFADIQKSISEGLGKLEKQKDDHETRLRRLEKWVWSAIGGLTIVQIIIGILK